MLGIVEHFANLNTKYAIFPYTSHAALGLSTAPTHEGRLQCRNVFVAYGDETFTILYQSEFGKTRTFDDRVDPSSAEITLKIVDWLGYDSASG